MSVSARRVRRRFGPLCVEVCAERVDRSTTVMPVLESAQQAYAHALELSDGEAAVLAARQGHEALMAHCANAATVRDAPLDPSRLCRSEQLTDSPRACRADDTAEMAADQRQTIVTLDLEGVLVPEIWIAVAERTGVEALKRTTRDEPDYDVLMRGRLAILDEHGLRLTDIADVIAELEPLAGARQFLDELRTRTQVLILSDTFEQFAHPLMRQLAWPTLLCHRLVIDHDDRVVDYRLRQPDQKRHAVEALHGLNYRVLAAGDSYNDIAMLQSADVGVLFRSPAKVQREYPHLRAVEAYDDLLALLVAEL